MGDRGVARSQPTARRRYPANRRSPTHKVKWPLVTPFSGVAGRKFVGLMMALALEPKFKGPIFHRRGARPGNGYNLHLKGQPIRKTGGVLGPQGWVV